MDQERRKMIDLAESDSDKHRILVSRKFRCSNCPEDTSRTNLCFVSELSPRLFAESNKK